MWIYAINVIGRLLRFSYLEKKRQRSSMNPPGFPSFTHGIHPLYFDVYTLTILLQTGTKYWPKFLAHIYLSQCFLLILNCCCAVLQTLPPISVSPY